MSNAKVFQINKDAATELPAWLAKMEIDIQDVFEKNLMTLLGIRFVASGKTICKSPKRRLVDTLGLDDNNYPVIIEVKRYKDQNVTNQGLAYRLHLLDHRGDFYMLVEKALGKKVADEIDWSTVRIICIASTFREYDQEAVISMRENIDLIEYKLFGDNVLLIDPVYIGAKKNYTNSVIPIGKPIEVKLDNNYTRRVQRLEDEKWKQKAIFDELLEFSENLGDDAEINKMKAYISVKRMSNFVSFQGLSKQLRVSIEMKPEDLEQVKHHLPEGTWEKIVDCKESVYRKGSMMLNFNVTSSQDAEFTKPFIERSYERA